MQKEDEKIALEIHRARYDKTIITLSKELEILNKMLDAPRDYVIMIENAIDQLRDIRDSYFTCKEIETRLERMQKLLIAVLTIYLSMLVIILVSFFCK